MIFNNFCLDCNTSCATCNRTTCDSCFTGFNFTNGTCLVNKLYGSNRNCSTNCSFCYFRTGVTGAICDSCNATFFLTNNTCRRALNCTNNSYFDSTRY